MIPDPDEIREWFQVTETITSYAAEIRYPSAIPKITIDEAREALDIANNVWRVIRGLIHI